MEQKRGQSDALVNAAATDPAALPGLIVPQPREGDDEAVGTEPQAEVEVEAEEPEAEVEAEDAGAEAPADKGEDAEADADTEADKAEGEDKDDAEAASEESAPAAEFEAQDRRGSVVADAAGVRFTLDDTEAEFDWDEIGAIEYATSRWGRRLTVTVHLRGRRLYETDITAPSKTALEEWTKGLDELMDAHFED
ncbi:hypothetical protein AB0M28_06355 [Streptomyces sp. NPDC051940]|uniref:hypothetical protein n=1 Tax=Streptomyces sp. NPDC051940 TaxID=3155675 RepID=UPI00341D6C96